MSAEGALLAYAACGLVIIVHAWLRSTTPAGLAFLMLVYLLLGAAVFIRSDNLAGQHPGGVAIRSTTLRLQLVTGSVLCWLMVRRAVANNSAPNSSPSFSGFMVKGFAAVLIGIGVSLVVHASASDPLGGTSHDLRSIVIGFPLCLAAAFFWDHRVVDGRLPIWLRCAESYGCTSTMGLGLLALYLGQLVPPPIDALHGWRLAVTMTLPISLAIVIGGCVPYIYRAKLRGPPGAAKQLVHQRRD